MSKKRVNAVYDLSQIPKNEKEVIRNKIIEFYTDCVLEQLEKERNPVCSQKYQEDDKIE